MGDFNINLLNSNIHNPTCEFVDTLYKYNFFPLINKPTRVTKVSATLIHNIFTNNIKHKGILSCILYTDITDHFPICHILNNNVQHGSSIIIKRDMSNNNVIKFHNLVKTTDWSFVCLESSCLASFSLFHKKLLEYFNACFPIKHVKSHYKNRKCWLSDTLKRLIIKKNKTYLLFKKFPNVTEEVLYKQYRSKVNSEMRVAERKYYQNMLENNKFNLKKKWQILKDIIGKSKPGNMSDKFLINGSIVEDSQVIANAFNNFYINIGSNLAGKI